LARGEFFVVQAGDDISDPRRTAALVENWMAPYEVDLVVSDVNIMNDGGQVIRLGAGEPVVYPTSLDQAIDIGFCCALGCAVGYSRRLYDLYGPLDSRIRTEDCVLPFRAYLGKGVRYVPVALLKYRVHGGNLGFGLRYKRRQRTWVRQFDAELATNRLAVVQDWLRAAELSGTVGVSGLKKLHRWLRLAELDLLGYKGTRFVGVTLAARALLEGLGLRKAAGLMKRHFLRVDLRTS
jgi:hypothetical protein